MKLKLLRRGAEMDSLIFIFIGCAIIMFVAIWVYNQKESTAFHETQKKIVEQNVKIKSLEDLLNSNISTVAQANTRIKSLEEKLVCFTGLVERSAEQVDNLQEHCARLREGQITIREMMAKKRPITKVQGPIEIQIVTPQQKIKADAAKVKKQIKDLGL